MTCKKVLVTFLTFILIIQEGDRKFVASVDTVSKDGNASSSTIDPPYDFRLSDLQPFEDQLAGHVYKSVKVKHPNLILMKDSDGNLLKPHPTQREIEFYESIYRSEDETLKQMKEVIPAYFGVKRVLVNDDGYVVKYLHMENIMKNYQMPCSMDVKIGLVRIPPGAPPRTAEQEARYRAMMVEWGFGIPGFSYYSMDGTKKKEGKEFGWEMTLDQAIETLYNFLQQQIGMKCKLVKDVIRQLQKIYHLYRKQNHFLLYDSSVLLTYDAKEIVQYFKKYSDYEQAISEFNCGEGVNIPVRVLMIDFGKTDFPSKEDVPVESREKYDSYLRGDPENYLRGVRNLILLLQHLDFDVGARSFKSE